MSMKRALRWIFAISLPACVYGLLMYVILALISGSALYGGRRSSVAG